MQATPFGGSIHHNPLRSSDARFQQANNVPSNTPAIQSLAVHQQHRPPHLQDIRNTMMQELEDQN